MKSPEFYKQKTIDSIEEGFSYEKGSKSWPELLKGLNNFGKYEKLVTVLKIIKEIAPNKITDAISNKIRYECDPEELPFNPDNLEFKHDIDKGGEHNVYLLESLSKDIPSYVLKTNFLHVGKINYVKKRAVEFRREYEYVKKLYESIPNIVLDEMTIIASDPKLKCPCIATIQKFIGTEMRDLFEDFSREELVNIFNENPKLLENFIKFIEITDREYKEKERIIDLVGKKICLL